MFRQTFLLFPGALWLTLLRVLSNVITKNKTTLFLVMVDITKNKSLEIQAKTLPHM